MGFNLTAESVASAILPREIENSISYINQTPSGSMADWEGIWKIFETGWSKKTKKALRNTVRNKHTVSINDISAFDKDVLTAKEKVDLSAIIVAKGKKIGESTYVTVIEHGGNYRNILIANVKNLKAELDKSIGNKVDKRTK